MLKLITNIPSQDEDKNMSRLLQDKHMSKMLQMITNIPSKDEDKHMSRLLQD
jgi:hypothetical protein